MEGLEGQNKDLVGNALSDRKPEERVKDGSNVVIFLTAGVRWAIAFWMLVVYLFLCLAGQ